MFNCNSLYDNTLKMYRKKTRAYGLVIAFIFVIIFWLVIALIKGYVYSTSFAIHSATKDWETHHKKIEH